MINFTVAANKEIDAMPNIACGAVPLFFAFVNLVSKEIKLREKLVSAGLVLFFFLSFIIRQLDYIWHGFHFPNMIYYRFSYLVSFVVIVMGFRAFMNIRRLTLLRAAAASVLSFMVLLMEFDFSGVKNPDGEGPYDQGVFNMFAVKDHSREDRMSWVAPTLIAVAIIFALITVLVILYTKRVVPMQAVVISLAIIVVAQSGYTAFFGVNVTTVTTMSGYPRGEGDTEAIINYMNDLEQDTPELWRAETASTQTLNDGALNHYHGLTMFNSMANEKMTLFFQNFGMAGWQSGNRFTYSENSPVTNLFMNLKYIISRGNTIGNTYDLSEVSSSGTTKLYRNSHYLPMGFIVNRDLLNWQEIEAENSFDMFEKQNEFFRLATGIKEPVYTKIAVTGQKHTDASQFSVTERGDGSYAFSCVQSGITPTLEWEFSTAKSALYLVSTNIDKGDTIEILRNGSPTSISVNMGRPYIAAAGYFNQGDTLSVKCPLKKDASGSAKVYVYRLNQEVFEQGYNLLRGSTMTTTYFRNGGKMEGTINAARDGLFYTSIPYEKGWKAYVDGDEVEITPVGGSLLAFPIDRGEHEITLKYAPNGFWPGLLVSIVCGLGFAAMCVLVYIRKQKVSPDFAKDREFIHS